jgi:methylenetetrahydrofolate reductase (NADPH)
LGNTHVSPRLTDPSLQRVDLPGLNGRLRDSNRRSTRTGCVDERARAMAEMPFALEGTEPSCPKHMVFGPCGGVRDDASCEFGSRPCPFTALIDAVPWTSTPHYGPAASSSLLDAITRGPVVVTDLSLPPFDAVGLAEVVGLLAGSADALLVGEHQNRPDYPPTLLAALISDAGGIPWVTLTCRDRNRLVLEQDLAGLQFAGADGVLCVTGDGRAHGVRPGVTQVFDLDGTRLAALAASAGLAVAVPESPTAVPRTLRPQRLMQKQRAGAHLAILNHVGKTSDVAAFVAAARNCGLTIPVIASVTVFTDERSVQGLQGFPGLQLDKARIASVLDAEDPCAAGIDSAVDEAQELLRIDGVVGVNVSGMASGAGVLRGAEIKAEVGLRIKETQ